jgi:hypothetical protein
MTRATAEQRQVGVVKSSGNEQENLEEKVIKSRADGQKKVDR